MGGVPAYSFESEDSYRKQVEVDGQACVLDIVDTAGQEEYSALVEQYMKSGDGFAIVFSITSPTSFEFAQKIHEKILKIQNVPQVQPLLNTPNCHWFLPFLLATRVTWRTSVL